jgi:hypothetical protein
MPSVLHLLGHAGSTLALAAIAGGVAAGDTVTVALLEDAPAPELPAGVTVHRVPDPLSYDGLLELVFAADQVIAW